MSGMKAWVYRPGEVEAAPLIQLEEVALPRPGRSDVLVEVAKVSVCGTDDLLFQGGLARAMPGIIPGHEVCGSIVEVGANVKDLVKGDVVALESHYSFDGATEDGVIGLFPPLGGRFRACHGGYAQYIAVPEECGNRLPPEMLHGDFWPSLFEPAGNDFLLARVVIEESKPGPVGVFGCGPHGLYLQVFLKHFGVPRVIAFETDPYRREFARRMGCAEAVLDPLSSSFPEQLGDVTGGRPLEACVDMVGGRGQVFAMCCELVRARAAVFLFGLFRKDVMIGDLAGNSIVFGRKKMRHLHKGKTIKVVGVTGREGIWDALIETVSGSTDIQNLLMKPVSMEGPLDRLKEHLQTRGSEVLKSAFGPFAEEPLREETP